MPGESARQVLRQLNTLFHSGVAGPLSDEELLDQFVAGTAESSEAAFSALVDRHGAMVLGVCRRVLGNRHAAEDVFQATFLVLSRKAPEIARREQLASWLYGVARRAALDARARASRQQASEKRLRIMRAAESIDEIQTNELRSILDEELGRLSERHRAALVLCELEGLSRREAAGRLGVSEGTLSSRLARAKIRLRDRLSRRGLVLSAAALATALNQDIRAATVPLSLVDSTIRIATMVAANCSLTGVASTLVVTLTEGVLKAMLLSKLKLAFLGLVTVTIITAGAGVVAQDRPSDNDRLKNLERKVDRLLEVLRGPSQRTLSPKLATAPTPEPNGTAPPVASTPALPTAPAAIAAVPRPPLAPAMPSAAAPSPAPAALPAQPAPPLIATPTRPGHSGLLDRRVDALEQRLAKLERRLAEFERRSSSAGASNLPAPSGGLVAKPSAAPRIFGPTSAIPAAPPAPPTGAAPAAGRLPVPIAPTTPAGIAPTSVPVSAVPSSSGAVVAESSAAEETPAEAPPPAPPEALPEN
jgi:RNA polymerase sigma factor (sigma-70 family)